MTRAGLGAGAGVSVSLIAADDEGAVLITARGYCLELETKVHSKVCNHGEGPYYGLLLVESGYYRFHI